MGLGRFMAGCGQAKGAVLVQPRLCWTCLRFLGLLRREQQDHGELVLKCGVPFLGKSSRAHGHQGLDLVEGVCPWWNWMSPSSPNRSGMLW